MLVTAEVRWFFKDSLPAAARDWFAEDRDLTAEERTDTYLVFPGSASVGVKLRNADPGRQTLFEIKALRSAPETIHLPGEVAGRADEWVKWSYPTDAFDELPMEVAGESCWLPVQKRRLLRTFSIDQGSVQEAPSGQLPQAGCTIDLVDLDTIDGDWWTLGFESFGAADLRFKLNSAATWWFERRPPPVPLRVTNSMPYPAWVAARAQDDHG